jgi:hypothetical protein
MGMRSLPLITTSTTGTSLFLEIIGSEKDVVCSILVITTCGLAALSVLLIFLIGSDFFRSEIDWSVLGALKFTAF